MRSTFKMLTMDDGRMLDDGGYHPISSPGALIDGVTVLEFCTSTCDALYMYTKFQENI